MSDPVSAMAGASFDGFVRVSDAGPCGMITVRGDLCSAKLRAAVTKAAGTDMPSPNGVVSEGTRGIGWMSPDELIVMVPHGDAPGAAAAMTAALVGEHALVVDVSDARAVFTLTGEGALLRETLAKLTPADLRPSTLPVGTLRRSRLAQVPAAFWFATDGEAHLICFRSVASYVFGILKHAATPGSEVGYYDTL